MISQVINNVKGGFMFGFIKGIVEKVCNKRTNKPQDNVMVRMPETYYIFVTNEKIQSFRHASHHDNSYRRIFLGLVVEGSIDEERFFDLRVCTFTMLGHSFHTMDKTSRHILLKEICKGIHNIFEREKIPYYTFDKFLFMFNPLTVEPEDTPFRITDNAFNIKSMIVLTGEEVANYAYDYKFVKCWYEEHDLKIWKAKK